MHEITSQTLAPVDFDQIPQVKGYEQIQSACSDYLSDESRLTLAPFDYLFFPRDERDLATIIRTLTRRRIPMTLAGARTGLVGGCVPPQGALISLEKLDQVEALFHVDWADEWRIRAQAAVCLADLNRMAMTKVFPELDRQASPFITEQLKHFRSSSRTWFYPPDPTEMSASLGGTAATNASGARTYRYGPTRDWVRKLRVMTMAGEILDIPRGKYFASPAGEFAIYTSTGDCASVRVPSYSMPRTKNTAGIYASPHMDLADLFIGSEGIFGVITAIDVALLPWEPRCSIVLFVASDEQALHLVQALRFDKRLKLDFLEFYSANALKLLKVMQAEDSRQVGMPPLPPEAGAAVFFELAFDPLAPHPDFSAIESTVAAAGFSLKHSWAGYEARELARFKVFRHLLPEKITQVIVERKKTCPQLHRLSSDLAVPDAHLMDMWNLYRERLDMAGMEWVAFGHVGNSHLHIATMPRNLEELQRGMALYAEFAEKAVAWGGTVSAEHGIGKIKAKFLSRMYSEEALDQMRAIKTALDPAGLLNPGNILN